MHRNPPGGTSTYCSRCKLKRVITGQQDKDKALGIVELHVSRWPAKWWGGNHDLMIQFDSDSAIQFITMKQE